MDNKLTIGLIREGKIPRDSRAVLTPSNVREILRQYPEVSIHVQPSGHRCFSDDEYRTAGAILTEDISSCDLLLGVKEVPVAELLPEKIYFFFSHTIKEQPYNRNLLREILKKRITLIDHECLTDDNGARLIAFGRWAGIVGAYNGLWTWAKRTGLSWPRASEYRDYGEMAEHAGKLKTGALRIAVTGDGRVAGGAVEMLRHFGIPELSPDEYLKGSTTGPVFTQLSCDRFYKRVSDEGFDLKEFFSHPELYKSAFHPYVKCTDLFINAIYWDPKAPAYFTLEEMSAPAFSIKVIADITCDIAPEASIPSTIRPSTIKEPVYGFDPASGKETEPYTAGSIDIMAVDNLPNELPRDASSEFGTAFLQHILPELFKEKSGILDRATIASGGQLGKKYQYLRKYAGFE